MKLFYVFSSLLLIAGLAHGQLRVGGSDLLEPHFSEALVEDAENRDTDMTINFAGSYPAMQSLRDGDLDLAILAIPEGQEIPEGDFRSIHLASKVLAIVVSDANPLNQMTVRQLAAVFGDAEASDITRWGQLGLTGEWASRSISLGTVSQSDHTLALDLFRHTVLQSRNMKRNVSEASGAEAVLRRLQQDTHSIALLDRMPSEAEGVKVLPIAQTGEDLAYEPTLENISNDDYPLHLPLYMVFPEERSGDLKDVLRFMIGDEAAQAIAACDLAPLSEQQRQSLLFEFERL